MRAEQKKLLERLRDPCIENKKDIYNECLVIEERLIKEFNSPYSCKKCKKMHRKGKKYHIHKEFALIKCKFPAINYPCVSQTINTELVGIYYTGKGHYIQRLPAKTELELRAEPHNTHDHKAVSIWHEGHKLGYIPRYRNSEVFHALQENIQVSCILGHYRPSKTVYRDYFNRRSSRRRRRYYNYDDEDDEDDEDHFWNAVSEFRPERADITVQINDPNKVVTVINGICELIGLGLQDIGDGFESMGVEAIRILESHGQFALHPNYKEILSKLYNKYKIPVNGEKDLNIFL